MGDISIEPSMEEILSSIKRIIAEEGDSALVARSRRGGRAAGVRPSRYERDADEILELSDPLADILPEEKPVLAAPTPPAPPEAAEPIVSERAAEAMRGPLEALSRMIAKPESKPEISGSETIEGLVRELLKPMLRDWLDANLPQMVEEMVAREISRITSGQG